MALEIFEVEADGELDRDFLPKYPRQAEGDRDVEQHLRIVKRNNASIDLRKKIRGCPHDGLDGQSASESAGDRS